MSARSPDRLHRHLSLTGAVLIGLGSMLGTGVFVSLALATQVAGDAVILSLLLAAGIAACNGLSSAQLAACYPVSGGTYEYGYRLLHPSLGFAAGWLFLAAKSASAAAAALGVGAYTGYLLGWAPGLPWLLLSLLMLFILTPLVMHGIRRTVQANAVMVFITVLGLFAYIIAGIAAGLFGAWTSQPPPAGIPASLPGVLQGAALLFVAYTGYGRIATLGEEVREPRRTIPRAVVVTVLFAGALYGAVASSSLLAVGSLAFADSFDDQVASLAVISLSRFSPTIHILVSVAAVTAMIGVLLNLLLGLSRVVLAMARRGDMPRGLGQLNAERTSTPAATLAVGIVVLLLTLTQSIRATWTFSAFTVLIYYGIANAAALRVPAASRFVPRAVSWLGLAGCLFLALWIDRRTWLLGAGLMAMGAVWYAVASLRRTGKVSAGPPGPA